jgi:flagellar biosynthetic protein FliO
VSSYTSYIVETLVTLVAVCGLAYVVLYGARKLGIGRASGPIRLVGQLPLDARRGIYLVKVGEHVLVVGVAEGGMTKLGEMPASELPHEEAAVPSAFAETLARALGRSKR